MTGVGVGVTVGEGVGLEYPVGSGVALDVAEGYGRSVPASVRVGVSFTLEGCWVQAEKTMPTNTTKTAMILFFRMPALYQ